MKKFRIKQLPWLSVWFLAVFIASCTGQTDDLNSVLASLKQEYGVNLHRLVDTRQLPDIVVYKVQQREAVIRLTPPSNAQFQQYAFIVRKALKKYPANLIAKHLSDIYIAGGYRESDGVITGMYEKDKVFLFFNHRDGDNSELFLEQTFHHEFSSILLKNYAFPAFEWIKLNPEGFNYIITPSKINEYMNSITQYHPSALQLESGLVSSYGKVNPENDINTYVELIFTEADRMKFYIAKYPRVQKKFKMIKDFYLSISPGFNSIFSQYD